MCVLSCNICDPFQRSDWKLHSVECNTLSMVDKERVKSLTPSIRLMVKLCMRQKLENEKVSWCINAPLYGFYIRLNFMIDQLYIHDHDVFIAARISLLLPPRITSTWKPWFLVSLSTV